MGIEYLLNYVKDYKQQDKDLIIQAYEFASMVHKDQVRKSKEAYIIHPLSVACILAHMHADAKTIAAGLLHDTIEDGKDISKEKIEILFGPTVANLVEGVTKLEKIDFGNNKELYDAANTRKIIESIMYDIRILIIKLADRLHNMRTEDFQPVNKQIEHSKETMDWYVPFAQLIGAYNIMIELEDYCFKYLKPNRYNFIDDIRKDAIEEYKCALEEMIIALYKPINNEGIIFDLNTSIKPRYELYKKYKMYGNIHDMHDLYAISLILPDIKTCYQIRDMLHDTYRYLEDKEKDYIANPKSNMYRALHTSIISPSGYKFQVQMQTEQMHSINTHGITAYWRLLNNRKGVDPSKVMQEEIKGYPFFSVLESIRQECNSTIDFNQEVRENLLSKRVKVKTPSGDIIELPQGSTIIDFAYHIHSDIGDNIVAAQVNGSYVELSYQLKEEDVVNIIVNKNFIGPRIDMLPLCMTSTARRKVKEYQKGLRKRINN